MEAYSGQSGVRGEERSAPQKPRFLEASIYVGEAGLGNNVGLSAIYQKPSGQDAEEDMPDDPEDPMSSRTPLTDPQNTQQMNRLVTPKDSGMLTSAAAAQKELRSILATRQQPQDERSHFKNAGTSTDLKGNDWDILSAQTRASMTDKETITDAEFEEIGICPCLATRYWTRFFRITNSDFLKRMFYSLLF